MADKKSSPVKRWNIILHRKRELMKRDPLGKELTACIVRQFFDDPPGREATELLKTQDNLVDQLKQKYDSDGIYVSDPIYWQAWRVAGLSRQQIEDLSWEPVGLQSPMTVRANWVLRDQILFDFDKGAMIMHKDMPRPLEGEDPTLTITVNLATVKSWHLEALAKQFKSEIKTALDSLSDEHRASPNPLAFLRTVPEEQFFKDLQRFDLHREHGLTFRMIALLEKFEKKGKTLDERARSKRIGFDVQGESSVRESVARIYQAIHRQPYKDRRKRLETPSEDIPTYHCPEHVDACDETCPFLKDWWERAQRTLPTDYSGAFKAIPLDDPADPTEALPEESDN